MLLSVNPPGLDVMGKSSGKRATTRATLSSRNRLIATLGASAMLVAIPLTIAAAGDRDGAVYPRLTGPVQAASDMGRIHLPDDSGGSLVSVGEGKYRRVTSMLDTRGRMTYGQYRWDEVAVPAGPVWVRVDTRAQTLSVFRGNQEIGTSVVLYGANSAPTPVGQFRVLERIADHRSRTYDAPMPYTLRLTADGVAIHGSEVMRGAATHGCIGVPVDFARHLFSVVRQGDEVFVIAEDGTAKARTHRGSFAASHIAFDRNT